MLKLTERAAAVLAETRSENGLPDHAGVRISGGASKNGQSLSYELRFTGEPAPDDIVVTTGPTSLFVAADVAQPLETAVLDAEETTSGEKLVLKRNV